MKSSTELRELRDQAEKAAFDWVLWEPEQDEVDESVILAQEETHHQLMEHAFNKYTFAKADFDPEKEQFMSEDIACMRIEEAMKILVNLNGSLPLQDIYKLHKAFIEFLEKDQNWGIPEWQSGDEEV